MNRAILLRYWGKQENNLGLGLGLVLLVEHSLAKIDPLIKLIEVVVFPLLGGNTHNPSTLPFPNLDIQVIKQLPTVR